MTLADIIDSIEEDDLEKEMVILNMQTNIPTAVTAVKTSGGSIILMVED